MAKQTIALVFGGQSSEHEVSCMSARNVIRNIDPEKYDLLLIGITKEGKWLLTKSAEEIASGAWREGKIRAIISPDAREQCVVIDDGKMVSARHIDLVFPVLHGRWGEDGTIQGLCELAKIPYVGCGVLASAVSMDKAYTKLIVSRLGVAQAASVVVFADTLKDRIDEIAAGAGERLGWPVFVKPANEGSSCGVSKADNAEELKEALRLAAQYDKKILVEEMIVGREIECAVLGGGKTEVVASGVGEILAAAEFYDYDAKYNNPDSQTVVDPELPESVRETIRQEAAAIFKAVDGYGLARVDFFVEEDGTVIFNEINTLPGFTDISMYPMLWAAAGLDGKELIQTLINLGLERYAAHE